MPLQLCTHRFPDGHTCGSPALRGEYHCFHHHPGRHRAPNASHRARRGFTLAAPRNRVEFLAALSEIIQRLAANKIDTKRASLLLYSLQIAAAQTLSDVEADPTLPQQPMRKSQS